MTNAFGKTIFSVLLLGTGLVNLPDLRITPRLKASYKIFPGLRNVLYSIVASCSEPTFHNRERCYEGEGFCTECHSLQSFFTCYLFKIFAVKLKCVLFQF